VAKSAMRWAAMATGAIDPAKPIVLQGNYQLEDGMEVRFSETETSAAGPAVPVEL
jgi:hypothetical protein